MKMCFAKCITREICTGLKHLLSNKNIKKRQSSADDLGLNVH